MSMVTYFQSQHCGQCRTMLVEMLLNNYLFEYGLAIEVNGKRSTAGKGGSNEVDGFNTSNKPSKTKSSTPE